MPIWTFTIEKKLEIDTSGNVDLRGAGVITLPDNLSVGRDLDLSGTGVTTLPDNHLLSIGGLVIGLETPSRPTGRSSRLRPRAPR